MPIGQHTSRPRRQFTAYLRSPASRESIAASICSALSLRLNDIQDPFDENSSPNAPAMLELTEFDSGFRTGVALYVIPDAYHIALDDIRFGQVLSQAHRTDVAVPGPGPGPEMYLIRPSGDVFLTSEVAGQEGVVLDELPNHLLFIGRGDDRIETPRNKT